VIRHLEKIYIRQIEPVMKEKCFPCHSQPKERIWWQNLPLLKVLVDRTLEKSLASFDMTMGFPFVGSHSVKSDFVRLRNSLLAGKMPPAWWVVVSTYDFLSPGEKRKILDWIGTGLSRLESSDQG